ncbi:hypothetical protein PCANC_04663 [Puccinia coronata f. sp. avenae]|uniref:Glucanase n=1 Tax=Puccinia coronata f. sp. avenae TaxID=200324 RepID=A0A2N5W1R5_9BASI|nr:hypothetical protein PCANC_04663 [Puccinia coronata f. sp. avenae]
MKVDSSQKFTVITQFVTQGNTDDGDLIQINRFYVQNGQTIANAPVTIQNTKPTASLTDDFCKATKAFTGDTDSFSDRGGLKSMGAAMDNGMVLVMSIWDDGEAKMQWLDGTYPPTKSADAPGVLRGTCDKDSGDPQSVRQSSPDASVTFSNVKIGAIDQTLGGDGSGSPHRRYRRTQY